MFGFSGARGVLQDFYDKFWLFVAIACLTSYYLLITSWFFVAMLESGMDVCLFENFPYVWTLYLTTSI